MIQTYQTDYDTDTRQNAIQTHQADGGIEKAGRVWYRHARWLIRFPCQFGYEGKDCAYCATVPWYREPRKEIFKSCQMDHCLRP